MVSSRLYLNKGHMRFEDITSERGCRDEPLGDRRRDGGHQQRRLSRHLRLRLRTANGRSAEERANLLFINNGNRTFTEAAAQVRHRRHRLHHARGIPGLQRRRLPRPLSAQQFARRISRAAASDHPLGACAATTPGSYNELYRNNCHGTFTNVSSEAGILRRRRLWIGRRGRRHQRRWLARHLCLQRVTPNDVLYINNGNGTFTNKRGAWLKHTSFAGMGVDIADFNNDGWPDILQVDMLPRDLSGESG